MRASQARANFTLTEAPFKTLLPGILSTALSGREIGQQASGAGDDGRTSQSDDSRGSLVGRRR
jgi:hypothetical protein